MGCIFKYDNGNDRYLNATVLLNRLMGKNTEANEASTENQPLIIQKINAPVAEYSFSDIENKIIEKFGYSLELNKLLLLDKDYLDSIIFLLTYGDISKSDLNKILIAETQDQRKILIKNQLRTLKTDSIFYSFLSNIKTLAQNTSNKNKMIRTLISSQIGFEISPNSNSNRAAILNNLYADPTKSVPSLISSLQQYRVAQPIEHNYYDGIKNKFDFFKPGKILLKKNLNRLKTFENTASSINYVMYFETLQFQFINFFIDIRHKENTVGYQMESNADYYSKLSDIDTYESGSSYWRLDSDTNEYVLYTPISQADFDIKKERLFKKISNYNASMIYYKKDEDGNYIAQNGAISQSDYSDPSNVWYRRKTEDYYYVYDFSDEFSLGKNILKRILNSDINIQLEETRLLTEGSKSVYKSEILDTLYNNEEKLDSLGLYAPIVFDCLKNYVEWLFDDDAKNGDDLLMKFDYRISDEIKTYIDYIDLLQKIMLIDSEIVTQDVSLKNFLSGGNKYVRIVK